MELSEKYLNQNGSETSDTEPQPDPKGPEGSDGGWDDAGD